MRGRLPGCYGSLLSLAVSLKGRMRTVFANGCLVVPAPTKPQPRLVDYYAEVGVVRGIIAIDHLGFRIVVTMNSVGPVIMPTVPVVSVMIMAGLKVLALVVEMAIDALALGAHAVSFVVLAIDIGTVSLVFETMLDHVALTVQMSLDAFAPVRVVMIISSSVAAISEGRYCDQQQKKRQCDRN